MKSLTEKQVNTLEAFNGASIIRRHMNNEGVICYRLLDDKFNPLRNLAKKDVHKLVEVGALVIEGESFKVAKILNGGYIIPINEK